MSSAFPHLSAQENPTPGEENEDNLATEPTQIESFCVNCQENGVTTLLLTKIPHYKEVILMSFSCEACGYQNNEIQSGGKIQERGVQFSVKVESQSDLNRQVVKGDHAVVTIPELDLEIPSESQKGAVTNIEGILERVISGLEQDQPVRIHMDPDGAKQIDKYISRIRDIQSLQESFHFILRDASGNSFVENLCAPAVDPLRNVTTFLRTKEEDHKLGIYTQDELKEGVEEEQEVNKPEDEVGKDEVLHFPTNCPDCNAPAETKMKVTEIPHFKEVVIMATNCDSCGHKTNEVKSGGGIEAKGTRITLRVTDPTDLTRDVLKSETCSLKLPDLDFEIGGYALGGRFTTLEGILNNIVEQVESNPFLGTGTVLGDSTTPEAKKKLEDFIAKVKELMEGKSEFVVILDDPTGNSYLQNLYAPDHDPEMKVEKYVRTFEQNEELGLNDMKTENYGENEALLGS